MLRFGKNWFPVLLELVVSCVVGVGGWWFPVFKLLELLVTVVVGKRVLIQATSLYMYKLGSQTSQVVVYMKKAFQSEELFGDDKAGSRRPDWPAGARTVSDSMIEASSGGRCDSDYK